MDSTELRAENAFNRGMSEKAFDIEKTSFRIIDEEVGDHDYNQLEWELVRRVIHATADFEFVSTSKIIFHRDALNSGFNAIRNRWSECLVD